MDLRTMIMVLAVFANQCLGQRSARIEFKLLRLTNSRGILENGGKCDVLPPTPCDTQITGYVDLVFPFKKWPGTRRLEEWPIIFEKNNEDSPVINKVISGDLCSGEFRGAVLRLHAVDIDTGIFNSAIDDFECLGESSIVSLTQGSADWSDEHLCETKHNAANNRIVYRYRVYSLPEEHCGRPSVTPSSGEVELS